MRDKKGKDKFSRITIADQGDFPIEEKEKSERCDSEAAARPAGRCLEQILFDASS